MTTWKLLLVLSLAVASARCSDLPRHDEKPDLVCLVNFYLDIREDILEKLVVCDHIVICYDGLCNLPKQLRNFTDAKRIDSIRRKAPHAKILRQVEVNFDENFDPNHEVQNVEGKLTGKLFDGVELAFDSTQLDQAGQIKYAQFLKLLKRKLDAHLLITNSFVCKQHVPAFLLSAMIDVLDYVRLLPSSQNVSAEGSSFVPRVYSAPVAVCLLNANFPRNKIVLGLPTGGILVDPSAHRESPSGLIPYGNVCELRDEQVRHCEELQQQECSLFEDGIKLIYDDPNSAGVRALQVVGCRLRGIAIGLNYDDSAGLCVGSSFPLLGAIQNVFENRAGVSGFRGCPSHLDDSEEDCDEEHEIETPCDHHHDHSDSDDEIDCCCEHGKSCNECNLLNRLHGAVKTSENVVSISKNVADKVLDSLDRVVALVSYILGQKAELPEFDEDIDGSIDPQLAPSSLLGSVLTAVPNLLSGSAAKDFPLGLGVSNPALPPASGLPNVLAAAAVPATPLSPVINSLNISEKPGLVALLLETVNDTLQKALNLTAGASSPAVLGTSLGLTNPSAVPAVAPPVPGIGAAPVPASLVDSIVSASAGPLSGALTIPARSVVPPARRVSVPVVNPPVTPSPLLTPVLHPLLPSLFKRSTEQKNDNAKHLKEADNRREQVSKPSGKSAKPRNGQRGHRVKGAM